MAITVMMIVTFGLLIIGVPIGAALSLGLMALIKVEPITTMKFLAQSMYSGLASFSMLCVPFFMVAGSILDSGGLSKRLVRLANSFVGNITGGLGVVTVLSCMFFGAVSGSAAATAAAIGTIMIPMMIRSGYDKYYATGLVAVAGGLGVMVPPSYPLVLYGVTNSVSIGDLFIAGIVPSIVIGLLLMAFNYVVCRKHGYGGSGEKFNLKEAGKSFWDAKLALLMPLIILGGIYGGIFTPTEASVVACVYGIIVGKFIYRELTWKKLWTMYVDNTAFIGGMMFVFAPAAAMGAIFAYLKIPAAIQGFFLGISSSPYVILTLIIFLMTVVGMFVQTSPAVIILSPILLGVVASVGIHPVHFGILMNACLCVAFITPPVAINLFVASGMTGLSITRMFRVAMPIVIALYLSQFVIAFLPGLSMGLVNLLK